MSRIGVYPATPKRGWDPETLHIGGEPATYQGNPQGFSWFLEQSNAGRATRRSRHHPLGTRAADAGRPMAMKPDMSRAREILSLRAIAETAGAGGDLVAPLYLQEEFLKLARAARPYADLLRKVPLPPNTNAINIPRLKTGTVTAAQSDLGTVEDKDLTTGLLTFHVITVAGQEDFARQLFDRSVPELADMVVFPDLIADYLTKSDVQVISGNGTLPNAKGALEVSERNKVTFTSGAPTLVELYKKIANAVQLIHTLRFMPPEGIVMHPARASRGHHERRAPTHRAWPGVAGMGNGAGTGSGARYDDGRTQRSGRSRAVRRLTTAPDFSGAVGWPSSARLGSLPVSEPINTRGQVVQLGHAHVDGCGRGHVSVAEQMLGHVQVAAVPQ